MHKWLYVLLSHALLICGGLTALLLTPALLASHRLQELFFVFIFKLCHKLFEKSFAPLRRTVISRMDHVVSHDPELRSRGAVRVLDVGAAYGPNLPFVHRPIEYWKVEPNTAFEADIRKNVKANPKVQMARSICGYGEDMSMLPDGHFDVVLLTYVLCSAKDGQKMLSECRRVLVKGGLLLYCEHVPHPVGSLARRLENIFTPLTKNLTCGCRLNRESGDLIKAAGFASVEMHNIELDIPFPFSNQIYGVATVNARGKLLFNEPPRRCGEARVSDDHFAVDLAMGMAFVFIFTVVVTVSLWLSSRFQSGGPAGSLKLPPAKTRSIDDVCVSRGCLEHAHVLNATLTAAFDPCRSMDELVCSSVVAGHSPHRVVWLRRTDRLGTLVSWTLDVLGRRPGSTPDLLHSMSALLRSCLYRSVDDEIHVAADFLKFMRERGLFMPDGDEAWPDPPGDARHPLDVLFDLEVTWKIHLWFKVRLLLASVNGEKTKIVIAPSRVVLLPQIQSTSVENTRTLAATKTIIHQRLHIYREILGASTASSQYPGAWADVHAFLVTRMTQALTEPGDHLRLLNATHSFAFPNVWAFYIKKYLGQFISDSLTDVDMLVEGRNVVAAIESVLAAHQYPQDADRQTEGNREQNIVLLAVISWWFLELYVNVVSPRALAAILKTGSVSLKDELTLKRLCVVQLHQAYAATVTTTLANHYFRSQVCRRNVVALLEAVKRLVADSIARTPANGVAHLLRASDIRIWPRRETLRLGQRLQLVMQGAAAKGTPDAFSRAHTSGWSSGNTVLGSYWQRLLGMLNKTRELLGTPDYRALHEMVDYDEQAEDFVHRPSEKALVVPLSALAIPLYGCDATDAVNIGGLGGAFARYLVKAFDLAKCPKLPLKVAYTLFTRPSAIGPSSLKRPKQFALHKHYSAEQMFFLTYCLNTCGLLEANCTALFNSFPPFRRAFRCPVNTDNQKADWSSRCPQWGPVAAAS